MNTKITRRTTIVLLLVVLGFSFYRNIDYFLYHPLVFFEPICTANGFYRFTEARHRDFELPASDALQMRGEPFGRMRHRWFEAMFHDVPRDLDDERARMHIQVTWRTYLDDEKSYELTRAAVESFVHVRTLEDQSLSKDIDTYVPGFSEGKLPCDELRVMVTEGRLPRVDAH